VTLSLKSSLADAADPDAIVAQKATLEAEAAPGQG